MLRFSFIFPLLLVFFSLQGQQKISGKSKVKQIQFKQTVNEQGVRYKAELEISNILFTDDNGNGALEVGESSFLSFTLTNKGKGEATDVNVILEPKRKVSKGLSYNQSTSMGMIYPGQSTQVYIPISANAELEDGANIFLIRIEEKNGFNPSAEPVAIETMKFREPEVIVADALFSTNNGKPVELNYPVYVKALIQNVGEGVAENVVAEFVLPNDKCLALSNKLNNIGTLRSGESREIKFSFVATQGYAEQDIPVSISISESYNQYAQDKDLSVSFGDELLATHYSTATNEDNSAIALASLTPEVDKNIPKLGKTHFNRIALIIGNEDYQSKQSGTSNTEINVEFARNDARIFREYATKTLGIDPKNVFLLTDATAAEMQENIELVSKLAANLGPEAEIVFYYAGHGLPDEASRVPYLIPVDVSGRNLSAGIPVKDVYAKLGNSGANKITVFLDACFSGGGRNAGLIASRGIRVKPKDELLSGNIVVFSASSEQQTALPYSEKQHGMFTYFLLKAMQDSEGNLNYGELSDYLEKSVAIESLRVNRKDQQPNVSYSTQVEESWMNWEIK